VVRSNVLFVVVVSRSLQRPARSRLGWLLGLVGLLWLYPYPGHAQPREPGLSPTGSDIELESRNHNGYPAVRLADVDRALGVGVMVEGFNAAGRVGGRTLKLRVGSPFVAYADRVYQLSNAPYLLDGHFWVPAELLTSWMQPATGHAWQQRASSVVLLAADTEVAASEEVSPQSPLPTDPPAELRRPGPWRVVIDAGHGGKDPGSIGYKGVREKDVTLAIARKLYDRLSRDPAYEPILTRADDRFITLLNRPRVAINNDADIFISIHGNSVSSRQARGFETYFLGEPRSEEAKRVAIRENSVLELEDPSTRPDSDAMDYILTSLRQSMNVTESRHFAGVTQNALRSAYKTRDRGVKQAGYWVLVGASGSMPAVLVEVGFITNKDEAAVLRSSRGQDKVADSLATAIRDYFANYSQRLMAAGSTG